jgi:hypothetical protein
MQCLAWAFCTVANWFADTTGGEALLASLPANRWAAEALLHDAQGVEHDGNRVGHVWEEVSSELATPTYEMDGWMDVLRTAVII